MLLIVLLTALCGIIYELLLSTLSSYLVGNSIVQFSITIGFFLFGLGLGSYISKFVKNSEKYFLYVEIALALLGAFSVLIVKWAYIWLSSYELAFNIFYILIVLSIGTLVGLEIPLIAHILDKKNKNLKQTVGDVFSWDYIGSLIGTLLFPFILLPILGLTYTAFAIGFLNLVIAFSFLLLVNKKIKLSQILLILISFIILIAGALLAKNKIESLWEHFFFKEPIVLSKQTPYQHIVITKRGQDVRLYLNGHLQFLSLDENRYHTSLTYRASKKINSFTGKNLNILILGGGDGLAARNLEEEFRRGIGRGQKRDLKRSEENFKVGIEMSGGSKKLKVKSKNLEATGYSNGSHPVSSGLFIRTHLNYHITLVDLDPEMTHLAKTFPLLLQINKGSLNNPNVKVINEDAFNFLKNSKEKYDIIIADFPDPRNVELSKLYSQEFYAMILKHLKKNGVFTTQASSAFFSKEAFWDIYNTIKRSEELIEVRRGKKIKKSLQTSSDFSSDLLVIPHHTYIPSFGDWGFVSIVPRKFYNGQKQDLSGLILFTFDKDHQVNLDNLKVNSLENAVLPYYYLLGRKRYNE